ncbi:DUF1471 domain-containing protein [Pantoea cypripedii]|uniref:DUF1471 domain-containing protein n=1 Tax=Pantoea cypripedii TaxID=55209 RepID=UPI002FCAEC2A
MMKKLILSALLLGASVPVLAANNISAQEAEHFKLESLGNISVSDTGGAVSSPMDLHQRLSEMADAKGGKYYVVEAARQHGNNFDAVAQVYK